MNEAPQMAFAHMGIYVIDTAQMVGFYTRVLGFCITDRALICGANVVFLRWDPEEHHQIVLVPGRDPAHGSTINQISFALSRSPSFVGSTRGFSKTRSRCSTPPTTAVHG